MQDWCPAPHFDLFPWKLQPHDSKGLAYYKGEGRTPKVFHWVFFLHTFIEKNLRDEKEIFKK